MRLILLLASLTIALPLAAQRLEPGARVRLRPPCPAGAKCAPFIGEVRSITPDSIHVVDALGTLHAERITPELRIDLSHGMRRRILEGMGAGLAAGIVVGALAVAECRSPNGGEGTCGLLYLFAVPPSIVLGGIIGGTMKTEWWLPPPDRQFTIAPTHDGVRLGMRMAW